VALTAELVEVQARSLLRRGKTTDSWFVSRYGMNLYRGCEHACAYCDGRAEKYRVEGDFGARIEVKVNAPELLERELSRVKERGFIFIGGGVCDAYQPAEERYGLARRCLELIRERGLPVHVLTKSALVERDLELLCEINDRAGALVSFSVSTLDQDLADLFEPGCAPVAERLRLLRLLKERGLGGGVMLMPVLPLLADGAEQIDGALARFEDAGADFVLFSGMTLKPGRQREHLLALLQAHHPELVPRYRELYGADRWGNARGDYYRALERRFADAALRHNVPPRIPHRLYKDRVEKNVELALVLAHLGYLSGLVRGERRPDLAAASAELLRLRERLEDLAEHGMLEQIPRVTPGIARLVEELLRTGRCLEYEALMPGGGG